MGSSGQIENRRHAKRFRARHLAKIVLDPETMISGMVEEISTEGARISIGQDTPLPDDFDLYIAAHDLLVRRAHLCWRQDGFIGVSFAQPAAAGQARISPEDEADRVRVEIDRDDVPLRKIIRRGVA